MNRSEWKPMLPGPRVKLISGNERNGPRGERTPKEQNGSVFLNRHDLPHPPILILPVALFLSLLFLPFLVVLIVSFAIGDDFSA